MYACMYVCMYVSMYVCMYVLGYLKNHSPRSSHDSMPAKKENSSQTFTTSEYCIHCSSKELKAKDPHVVSLEGRVTILSQEKQQLADKTVRLTDRISTITEAGAKREQELSDKILSLEAALHCSTVRDTVVALPRPNPTPVPTPNPTPKKNVKGDDHHVVVDLSPHQVMVTSLRKSFDRMRNSARVELEMMQAILSDTKRYRRYVFLNAYVCMYVCIGNV